MLMKGKAEIVPQTASGFLDMISDLNALAAKGKIYSTTKETHQLLFWAIIEK